MSKDEDIASLKAALAAAREERGSARAGIQKQAERAEDAEARVEALETLLAASEARAAQWQADAESYRADATVAQDRLAALKAKVQRAVQRLTYDEELLAETRIERALEALRG